MTGGGCRSGERFDGEDAPVGFEDAESQVVEGVAKTFPMSAAALKKAGYVVISGRPCRIIEISKSVSQVSIVAMDLFTGSRFEDAVPAVAEVDVPVVERTDYTLIDVDNDTAAVSLMPEDGEAKDDLTLPKGTAEADRLSQQIKADFEAGQDLQLSVLSAMGEEAIVGSRIVN